MKRDTALAGIHSRAGDEVLRHVVDRFGDHGDIGRDEFREVLSGILPTDVVDNLWGTVEWDKMERSLQEIQVRVLTLGEADYPVSLRVVRQPPPLLYVIGDLTALQEPGIGICGSRKASPKGLEYARIFGAKVARLGLPEVSGYARGVDTEAHLGALEAGGRTVIVLAEGMAHFRLKQVFRSIEGVLERITVVSEFHPARPWQVASAMKRNRTICALSKGVVVVEAGDTGGTLDAGKECLRQGKPLLVVQHGEAAGTPAGNLELIRAGGIPVTSRRDLERRLVELRGPAVAEDIPFQLPLVS